MTMSRMKLLAIGLAVAATGQLANPQTSGSNPLMYGHSPKLVNTCLITNDVERLVDFYEAILLLKARKSGEDYAEFPSDKGVLAIFSVEAQEKYIPGSTVAAKNRSAILEFRVGDVDREYRRLQSLVKVWVKSPTTQPWGTRSIYFRDPDGNLVDFYALLKK